MTLLIAGLEWRVALVRRRLFMLNVVVPLLLITPIALGAAPPYHAAAVYAVLFALFGTFGSTIPAVRDAESGLLTRLLLGGVGPVSWVLQRALAGAVLDGLQLLPAVGVAAIGAGARLDAVVSLALVVPMTLWVANLLGVVVAALARSVAEAALFAAAATLLLLHASGVFRTPALGTVGAAVEWASPYRALHETLLSMTTGAPPHGGMTAVAWCAALPLVLAALSGPLVGSLGRAHRS